LSAALVIADAHFGAWTELADLNPLRAGRKASLDGEKSDLLVRKDE
jgi:hypothetical protein